MSRVLQLRYSVRRCSLCWQEVCTICLVAGHCMQGFGVEVNREVVAAVLCQKQVLAYCYKSSSSCDIRCQYLNDMILLLRVNLDVIDRYFSNSYSHQCIMLTCFLVGFDNFLLNIQWACQCANFLQRPTSPSSELLWAQALSYIGWFHSSPAKRLVELFCNMIDHSNTNLTTTRQINRLNAPSTKPPKYQHLYLCWGDSPIS